MSSLFRGRRYYATSLLISLVAVSMIAFHAASWGQIDLTSVALFLILIAPWLFPFVTKISLPGGGGIEIREVEALERQTEGIVTPGAIAPTVPNQVALAYRVVDEDPNLALASIRMGIEQNLRQISGEDEERVKYPLGELVRTLARRGALSKNLIDPIDSITRICNRALHQADVDRPTAQRVIAASIPVFEALNNAADRTRNSPESA